MVNLRADLILKHKSQSINFGVPKKMAVRNLKCGKCQFSTTNGVMELAKHLKKEHFRSKWSSVPNKISLEAQSLSSTGLNDHKESVHIRNAASQE